MHYKQNNKESKTFVQGLRPFGNTLPRGLRGILKKNGYNYSEIISKWRSLVGKEISNICYPKLIKTSKLNSNGILMLEVNRGNEIDVEYSKNEIINKINSYFGYKLINEIKLQTFNAKKKHDKKNLSININKNFKKKIDEIGSKKIRESLNQLIETVKNEKK